MPNTQDDALKSMRDLISTGIIYEDEFIDKYFKILRDTDFMDLFGDKKHEAEILFSSMIEESRQHKQDLEGIYEKLS
jgi:hypothetical protein